MFDTVLEVDMTASSYNSNYINWYNNGGSVSYDPGKYIGGLFYNSLNSNDMKNYKNTTKIKMVILTQLFSAIQMPFLMMAPGRIGLGVPLPIIRQIYKDQPLTIICGSVMNSFMRDMETMQ